MKAYRVLDRIRFALAGGHRLSRLAEQLKQQTNQAKLQIKQVEQQTEQMLINQGRILATLNRGRELPSLRDYSFKVFSQWGEDGIIQRLLDVVPIGSQTFIEFGVETFKESNCRFLMMKDNWRGLIIDASADDIARCRSSYYFWRHDLQTVHAFVTRDNINELLRSSGFGNEVGIVSVDVDGVDYWILDAIELRPAIFIAEYNAVFGIERAISVPYDAAFDRTKAHYSNLYFGASLPAISHAVRRKGYSLVGTNDGENNAFYVRDDLMTQALKPLSDEEAFQESTFRESRDRSGHLTMLRAEERIAALRGMSVVNVLTGSTEKL